MSQFPECMRCRAEQAEAALARVRALVEQVSRFTENALVVLRRENYVFKRFPRNMKEQPPVGDGERWEALAFHFYAQMAEASSHAEQVKDELDAALRGAEAGTDQP